MTLKFFNCQCEPCAAGTVQPLAAQKTCVACPAGWFNARDGAGDVRAVSGGDVQHEGREHGRVHGVRRGDVGEEHAGGLLRKDDALVASAGDGGWIDVRSDVSGDVRARTVPRERPGEAPGTRARRARPGITRRRAPRRARRVQSARTACSPAAPPSTAASRAPRVNPTTPPDPPNAGRCARSPSSRAPRTPSGPRGAYDALELARARPRISYTDDGIDDYRSRLCKIGCETFGTQHWCASFGLPNVNDCDGTRRRLRPLPRRRPRRRRPTSTPPPPTPRPPTRPRPDASRRATVGASAPRARSRVS